MGYISCHITPLVINSLGADTQTQTHTDICTETILRIPGVRWLGLKGHFLYIENRAIQITTISNLLDTKYEFYEFNMMRHH